ncbi:S24/S26 family peptidase [Plantactinospora sp. BC1]|uniref:S24/S26 family peptidase n=1 Tax=Plantactinospora sp. BC1 TaxID=2108470 RepID=UPI00131F3449|nr:S24/S26 family peptidase [Plantactinospora sp. BC1]
MSGFADGVRATLAAGGLARVPVTGSGMVPVLSDGTVVVEPVEFDQVCPGEVVAYQHGDGIVVHRVVARLPEHLLTAGDNLPLYDPPVPRAALLGRVPQVPARAPGAPAVGGPPLPLPDGVTLWLVGAAARAVPETDHQLPVSGSRRTQDLVRVRHLAAGSALPDRVRRALDALDALGGVTVGISPAAVRPVDDLRTALAGRSRPARPAQRLDIVLGCRFGAPAPSGGRDGVAPVDGADDAQPVIAPDDVDHHLRTGPPLSETGPVSAIRTILATLGVPPLPGFPQPALDGAP